MTQRRPAFVSVLILLGGCATLPVEPDGLSFPERQDQIAAIQSWEMRGRIAIDTGDDA